MTPAPPHTQRAGLLRSRGHLLVRVTEMRSLASPADEAHGVRTPCRSSTSATFSATRVGGGAQRGIIDQSCRDSDNISALLTLPTARRRPGGGVTVPPSPPPSSADDAANAEVPGGRG